MSDPRLPLGYANDLIFELEKAFYDERGKGARFRTTNVGQRYFRDRCLPQLNRQRSRRSCAPSPTSSRRMGSSPKSVGPTRSGSCKSGSRVVSTGRSSRRCWTTGSSPSPAFLRT